MSSHNSTTSQSSRRLRIQGSAVSALLLFGSKAEKHPWRSKVIAWCYAEQFSNILQSIWTLYLMQMSALGPGRESFQLTKTLTSSPICAQFWFHSRLSQDSGSLTVIRINPSLQTISQTSRGISTRFTLHLSVFHHSFNNLIKVLLFSFISFLEEPHLHTPYPVLHQLLRTFLTLMLSNSPSRQQLTVKDQKERAFHQAGLVTP